ncbi:hypothetical protein [Roseibium alexandrii]|uniref:Uncharacterized protein n=1 Tax=Roseibium alexandrii (strain DSM 17067 / NCIMB 14079 / DFL-11) TaxID=244592 RepID=A0A5E8H4K8_ROSAD|nr:hypothetical protein [Roseibium alexandrii]EEE47508.1 hypothetical protein SADFL11_4797 [Roseibium alexandrii DFL-11]
MDKIEYRVRAGVDWVNGTRVPDDRRVKLTASEALYDQGLGRIEPVAEKSKSRRKKSADPEDVSVPEAGSDG